MNAKKANEILAGIRDAMTSMREALMQQNTDAIQKHADTMGHLVMPLRDCMTVIGNSSEEDKNLARGIVKDIKKTCKRNNTIASAFNMLLKSTLSSVTDAPASQGIYGNRQTGSSSASPLLIHQKG